MSRTPCIHAPVGPFAMPLSAPSSMSLPRASRPELSVVIPVRDEEENLHALLERLFRVLQGSDLSFEVLCVNDGSVDGASAMSYEATIDSGK